MFPSCKSLRQMSISHFGLPLLFAIALCPPGLCRAQYLGVTCGYNYSNDLTGPNTGKANLTLYNPQSTNPNATWDSWAEQLRQSGVDFVCPNLRGSNPNTS